MKAILKLLFFLGVKNVFCLKCYVTDTSATCVKEYERSTIGDAIDIQTCFDKNMKETDCPSSKECVKDVKGQSASGNYQWVYRRCGPPGGGRAGCLDFKDRGEHGCHFCSKDLCNGTSKKNITPKTILFFLLFLCVWYFKFSNF